MSDIQAKIAEIETEMARTQKNKATNYHLGYVARMHEVSHDQPLGVYFLDVHGLWRRA
jgi:ribosome-interacting GTPase 1